MINGKLGCDLVTAALLFPRLLRVAWDVCGTSNSGKTYSLTIPWPHHGKSKQGTKAPTTEGYVPRQIVNSTLCSSSKFGGRHAASPNQPLADELDTFKCLPKLRVPWIFIMSLVFFGAMDLKWWYGVDEAMLLLLLLLLVLLLLLLLVVVVVAASLP